MNQKRNMMIIKKAKNVIKVKEKMNEIMEKLTTKQK